LNDFDYYQHEFSKLDSDSEFYRMKITSDTGETKWLNIDPAQLETIKLLLMVGGGA